MSTLSYDFPEWGVRQYPFRQAVMVGNDSVVPGSGWREHCTEPVAVGRTGKRRRSCRRDPGTTESLCTPSSIGWPEDSTP